MVNIIYICNKCLKEFENHRRRKTCFECTPQRNTYSSREEYQKARRKSVAINVKNKRKRLKQDAVAYKGGKCERCGYDKCIDALEFHHLDATQKDFGISAKGYTRAWSKVKEELDKCVMVCANCHREIHNELKQAL